MNSALGENKIAVLLFGGDERNLKIGPTQYRMTAEINGTSVVELAVNKLREEGFKTIYIVARQQILTEIFKLVQNGSRLGVEVEYVPEKTAEGTADSLRHLKGKIKTNFLVAYGDIIFNNVNLEELWNSHLKAKGITTLLLTTTPTPSKKGVVRIEGTKILDFMQKPEKSNVYLGFSSLFVTQPEILEYPGKSLEVDIFPYFAKKGLLNGYLSTSDVLKIHTKKDVEEVAKTELINNNLYK